MPLIRFVLFLLAMFSLLIYSLFNSGWECSFLQQPFTWTLYVNVTKHLSYIPSWNTCSTFYSVKWTSKQSLNVNLVKVIYSLYHCWTLLRCLVVDFSCIRSNMEFFNTSLLVHWPRWSRSCPKQQTFMAKDIFPSSTLTFTCWSSTTYLKWLRCTAWSCFTMRIEMNYRRWGHCSSLFVSKPSSSFPFCKF